VINGFTCHLRTLDVSIPPPKGGGFKTPMLTSLGLARGYVTSEQA